jgi:hypothetical protein
VLVEPRAHSRSRWLVKGRGLPCCTRRAATQWRTVQTDVSWFREECALAQGKKLWANRCSKGARGAAVPCQPKPLARTWMSAVPDSQTPRRFGKDGSARSMSGDWLGVNAVMRLLKQAAHLPDASIDENAPSRGVTEGVVDFGRLVAKSAKAAIGSVGRKVRTSPVFASLFEGECRKRRKRSRHCRCQTATD